MIVFWAGFLLVLTLITIFAIYFIAKDEYRGKFEYLKKLDINVVPSASFFKFIYPIFILVASIGLFISTVRLQDSSIIVRWFFILLVSFLIAYLLFGNDSFKYWALTIGFFLILVVLLGETIYYLAVTSQFKAGATLCFFFFIWAVYGLFLTCYVSATMID